MADLLNIEVGKDAIRALRQASKLMERSAINTQLEKFLRRPALATAGHVVRTKLTGPTTDDTMRRRTGHLAKSVTGLVVRDRGIPAFRVGVFKGPSLAYAHIHEFGGTIRPKRARALAIPVEEGRAMTKAGVHRYNSPREYPWPLVYIPTKSKKKISRNVGSLWDDRDIKEGEIKPGALPVYLLVKRVTMPAREWLKNGVTEYIPTVAVQLGEFFEKLVANAIARRGRR